MQKIVLFAHVSLDGFVAGPGGEMDWIATSDGLFEFVEQRIQNTNTALYGRKTYQMMEGYWPTAADQPDASPHDINHSRWYKAAQKAVISRSLTESKPNTRIIGGNLVEETNQLKQEAQGEILMFGSPSAAHALMAHNLIDGYWLFVNPVTLGQGMPLFRNQGESKLRLVSSHLFESGVMALSYETL